MMIVLVPMPMRSLFCPVAAGSHAAPAAPVPPGMIGKKQRAGWTFASLHL
jgi:hypothetical protein